MPYKILQVLTITVARIHGGQRTQRRGFPTPLAATSARQHACASAAWTTSPTFGRIMPFWYSAVALLTIALAWMGPPFRSMSGRLLLAAAILWLVTIVYTVILPKPLNSRIAAWPLESMPADWQAQERRWDRFHVVRTFLLVAAFTCLVASAVVI